MTGNCAKLTVGIAREFAKLICQDFIIYRQELII